MRSLLLRGAQILRPGGPASPLDALAASLYAVFGLRRLLATWSGPLVTVRRSSDGATMDVYAAGDGWIDTAALLAWCGTASAYVTRWWDQTGRGQHAEQGTASAQLRIVNAGTLEQYAGRPAIRSLAGTRMLASMVSTPAKPVTIAVGFQLNISDLTSSAARIFCFGSDAEGTKGEVRITSANYVNVTIGGSVVAANPIMTNMPSIAVAICDNTQSNMRFNGVSKIATTVATTLSSNMILLNMANIDRPMSGLCSEIVLFNKALTLTEAASIEASLGAPRGVTLP